MVVYRIIIQSLFLSLALSLASCSYLKGEMYAQESLEQVLSEYDEDSPTISVDRLNYAYNYYQERKNPEMRALAYYLRSVVHEKYGIGSEVEWMDDLAMGCREVERCDNDELAARLFLENGISMVEHGWYSSAVQYLEKSLNYSYEAECHDLAVLSLMNLSHSYLYIDSEDSRDKAIMYSKEAARVALSSGLDVFYGKALFALCSCYISEYKYDEALKAARDYVEISQRNFNSGKRKESVRYFSIAHCYYHLGQADSVIFYAAKDTTHESLSVKVFAYELLANTHKNLLNEDVQAAIYQDRFYCLRDSLASMQKNEEILKQNARRDIEFSRSTYTKSIIIILVISAILLSALLFFFMLLRRKLHQKDNALKNESALVQDMQKNMESLKLSIVDSDDFVNCLKNSPRYLSDSEWDRMIAIVNRIDNSYVTTLVEAGVTDYSLRIAAAMRLDFTTSESAVLLGIEAKSVTKAKQRIKAKINKLST